MTGIVTVTLSAAIDQTYVLAALVTGAVNRSRSAHREVSGKGVNVARAIDLAGHSVSAVLALGEQDLPLLAEIESGQVFHTVAVPGHTRVNTTIIDDHGQTTKVNEPSIPLTREQWHALRDLAMTEIERLDADWLVLCGTVPTLVETGELVPFGELVEAASVGGTRVAVDTSGEALDLLVARHLGDLALIKPNTHELADAVGRDLESIGDVIAAAQELRARGVDTVYVSMGEDGALAVAQGGVWWARAAAPALVNAAGAGDASLAGFLVHALEHGVPAALSAAASWGALAVSQPTTLLSAPDTAPAAELVASPDPERKLRDPARASHRR